MTDVRRIPPTKGKVALVDAAACECVSALEWPTVCSNGRWYAAHFTWKPKRQILMHRFILGAPPRVHVGFVNADSLECWRYTLRLRKDKSYYVTAPGASATRASHCRWSRRRRRRSGATGTWSTWETARSGRVLRTVASTDG